MNKRRRPKLSDRGFDKGLVEVFTGNGKGKTSAALGIALRALGHNLRVHIIYFLKGDYLYGERVSLSNFPNVDISIFGHKHFIDPEDIKPEEIEQARLGLEMARQVIHSGNYDVVILDEINIAAAWKLLDVDDVLELIRNKPEKVELILTGRYADPKLIEAADLVTDMTNIKHPYERGILSRKGIDY